MADELIANLKNMDDEEGVQQLPMPVFASGDTVRITDGVMAGYEGIFHAKNGKERVTVLLEYTGKHMKIDISQHHIERVM